MSSVKEKKRTLIAIDLDNTVADYTSALKDCLEHYFGDDMRKAPEPSDYDNNGWFLTPEDAYNMIPELVDTGLYLREKPYPHAREVIKSELARDYCTLLVAPREADIDLARWMWAYHVTLGNDQDLGKMFPRTFLDHLRGEAAIEYEGATKIRELVDWGHWHMGDYSNDGVSYCCLYRKELLKADLYIEDNPHMLDTLMDAGLPVLAKRHGYNGEQCERIEKTGCGAVFDSWDEVPGLVRGILGEDGD